MLMIGYLASMPSYSACSASPVTTPAPLLPGCFLARSYPGRFPAPISPTANSLAATSIAMRTWSL